MHFQAVVNITKRILFYVEKTCMEAGRTGVDLRICPTSFARFWTHALFCPPRAYTFHQLITRSQIMLRLQHSTRYHRHRKVRPIASQIMLPASWLFEI